MAAALECRATASSPERWCSWPTGGRCPSSSFTPTTVTFGSGGPGAMRFGFAEANSVAKKAA
jgi:hypothetical protein